MPTLRTRYWSVRLNCPPADQFGAVPPVFFVQTSPDAIDRDLGKPGSHLLEYASNHDLTQDYFEAHPEEAIRMLVTQVTIFAFGRAGPGGLTECGDPEEHPSLPLYDTSHKPIHDEDGVTVWWAGGQPSNSAIRRHLAIRELFEGPGGVARLRAESCVTVGRSCFQNGPLEKDREPSH